MTREEIEAEEARKKAKADFNKMTQTKGISDKAKKIMNAAKNPLGAHEEYARKSEEKMAREAKLREELDKLHGKSLKERKEIFENSPELQENFNKREDSPRAEKARGLLQRFSKGEELTQEEVAAALKERNARGKREKIYGITYDDGIDESPQKLLAKLRKEAKEVGYISDEDKAKLVNVTMREGDMKLLVTESQKEEREIKEEARGRATEKVAEIKGGDISPEDAKTLKEALLKHAGGDGNVVRNKAGDGFDVKKVQLSEKEFDKVVAEIEAIEAIDPEKNPEGLKAKMDDMVAKDKKEEGKEEDRKIEQLKKLGRAMEKRGGSDSGESIEKLKSDIKALEGKKEEKEAHGKSLEDHPSSLEGKITKAFAEKFEGDIKKEREEVKTTTPEPQSEKRVQIIDPPKGEVKTEKHEYNADARPEKSVLKTSTPQPETKTPDFKLERAPAPEPQAKTSAPEATTPEPKPERAPTPELEAKPEPERGVLVEPKSKGGGYSELGPCTNVPDGFSPSPPPGVGGGKAIEQRGA